MQDSIEDWRKSLKKLKYICITAASLTLLTGCSAILPKSMPTLPVEDEEEEENLPTVVEVEVPEVSGDMQTIETEKTQDQTQLEPFETSDLETEESAYAAEEIHNFFLTEADVNYIYEVAYKTGDYSELDEEQVQVLSIAAQVVEECAELSTYEKALYVHDYLTSTTTYGFSENPYSEYGALVENMAVCQGYSYAYKLCMDLLEIPCITVGGEANNGEYDLSHAWNMIQIDGIWYHVDVTWDDATTSTDYGSWCHLYFCVDDEFMSQNHAWTDMVQDYHNMGEIPSANDMSLFYFNNVSQLMQSQEQFQETFVSDFESGLRKIEFCCYGFEPDASFIGEYAAGSLIYQQLGQYTLIYIDLQ